ncbi:TTN [Mytilus coruscus]|uniref:TTN n=1 Tax=Mytilus coruscus TaxID=42192 RepID=A0A6J8CCE1_MYTCO|nr:TTN [Mytilus coruscus]
MSKNQGTEIYAQGLILTKNLKDLNIDIIGDYSKSICNLIIRNVSDVDIGNYTCESWKSGLLYVHKFTLYLKSPPTNLTFLNTLATKDKKIIRGIDGQTLDIVCNVKSGRPEGTLLLTQNGSNVAMGGSSTLVYSFTPTKRDNMKLFKCSAFSEMLELPLTDEVSFLQITFLTHFCGNSKMKERSGVIRAIYSKKDIKKLNQPQTPTNMTVVQYESHMIVSWIPEFNGGFKQDFFIQYRTDDTELWTTTGPVKDNLGNKMKYAIYELVSTKQYFVRMFSRNIIGDSNITNIAVEYQLKTRAAYDYCSVIIGNIVGGMLICCIGSHIYCRLWRNRRSNATMEISPEGQYDEIGTINYNNVIVDPITSFEHENNDNISNDDESNAVSSSAGRESSNASSFIGQPGDGYENEYQAVIPSVIEMHQYTSIIQNIYQNTMISPASAATKSAKHTNIAIDSYTKPWLVIYKRMQ